MDKADIHFIRQKNGKNAANIIRSDKKDSRSVQIQSSTHLDTVVVFSTLPRLLNYDAQLASIVPDTMHKQVMDIMSGKQGLIESGW